MKKVFIQIRQWILKHRKRIIYGALALFVFQICFFDLGGIGIENNVFAEDATPKNDFQSKLTKWDEELSFFKVVLYVLVYPILIVAGKLVDNSMVYGAVFGFDSILRKLWVLIRNIANYGLGGLVLYNIFKFLITGQKTDDIKKLLISSLIAGVGIQASWFIMTVLIDASTLVTYGIGGLPTTALEGLKNPSDSSGKTIQNPYILKTSIYYDANKNPKNLDIYMSTNNNKYISECETFEAFGDKQETLILAPKYIYYKADPKIPTERLMCNYENNVYFFSNLYGEISRQTCDGTEDGCSNSQADYYKTITEAKNTLGKGDNINQIRQAIEQGVFLQIGDAHAASGINGNIFQGISYGPDQHRGKDVNNERNGTGGNAKKMSELIDGTYAGVFTSLYTKLLGMGIDFKITNSEAKGDPFVTTLNDCLSIMFLLVITVPLLAMTIVLIIRIFVLRVAIAISPLIVLLTAFGLFKKVKDGVGSKGIGEYLEYFEVSNLIQIIFFPAVMGFTVSISSVLVEIIGHINAENIATHPFSILSGIITIDIGAFGVGLGKVICSIISLAVTRFLLRACIQFTKIGKGETGIVPGLKKLVGTAMGSLPIIPIPTPEGIKTVGIDTAFRNGGGIFNSLASELKTKFYTDDRSAIKNFFDRKPPVKSATTGGGQNLDAGAYVTQLISKNPSQDWTNEEIEVNSQKIKFNDMPQGNQEEIIKEINKLDDNLKKQLGAVSPHIITKGGTYDYDTNKNEYKPQSTSPSP